MIQLLHLSMTADNWSGWQLVIRWLQWRRCWSCSAINKPNRVRLSRHGVMFCMVHGCL